MPPQQWPNTQNDQRTFGAQQQRTLDDLNRPNLQGVVTNYLQDAMRFWQRKPFFFTDADNSDPLVWTASVQTTIGTTIQYTSTTFNPGAIYNFVAANAGLTGTTAPNFESILGQQFVPPPTTPPPPLPPPATGTAGTIDDNGGAPVGVRWLNNGPI